MAILKARNRQRLSKFENRRKRFGTGDSAGIREKNGSPPQNATTRITITKTLETFGLILLLILAFQRYGETSIVSIFQNLTQTNSTKPTPGLRYYSVASIEEQQPVRQQELQQEQPQEQPQPREQTESSTSSSSNDNNKNFKPPDQPPAEAEATDQTASTAEEEEEEQEAAAEEPPPPIPTGDEDDTTILQIGAGDGVTKNLDFVSSILHNPTSRAVLVEASPSLFGLLKENTRHWYKSSAGKKSATHKIQPIQALVCADGTTQIWYEVDASKLKAVGTFETDVELPDWIQNGTGSYDRNVATKRLKQYLGETSKQFQGTDARFAKDFIRESSKKDDDGRIYYSADAEKIKAAAATIPRWVEYQIGGLSKQYTLKALSLYLGNNYKRFEGVSRNAEDYLMEERLDCSSVSSILSRSNLDPETIDALVVDVSDGGEPAIVLESLAVSGLEPTTIVFAKKEAIKHFPKDFDRVVETLHDRGYSTNCQPRSDSVTHWECSESSEVWATKIATPSKS